MLRLQPTLQKLLFPQPWAPEPPGKPLWKAPGRGNKDNHSLWGAACTPAPSTPGGGEPRHGKALEVTCSHPTVSSDPSTDLPSHVAVWALPGFECYTQCHLSCQGPVAGLYPPIVLPSCEERVGATRQAGNYGRVPESVKRAGLAWRVEILPIPA